MANNPIRKWLLKSWCFKNFYKYDIYQVMTGNDIWFEATPQTPGCVTRTAESQEILKIILENDCTNIIKMQRSQRTR